MIELVLGGARSGKSRYAEQQVIKTGKAKIYLATAEALDNAMQVRISRHREDRGFGWHTIEEQINLAFALQSTDNPANCILLDCLSLWLSNCLLSEDPHCWPKQKQALLDALPAMQADVILVSNEVGQGIVPMGEINRRFVDEAGWLHQALAVMADKVTLVTAGIAQTLKDTDKR